MCWKDWSLRESGWPFDQFDLNYTFWCARRSFQKSHRPQKPCAKSFHRGTGLLAKKNRQHKTATKAVQAILNNTGVADLSFSSSTKTLNTWECIHDLRLHSKLWGTKYGLLSSISIKPTLIEFYNARGCVELALQLRLVDAPGTHKCKDSDWNSGLYLI